MANMKFKQTTYKREILEKFLSKEQLEQIDKLYQQKQIVKIVPALKNKSDRRKITNNILKKYGI